MWKTSILRCLHEIRLLDPPCMDLYLYRYIRCLIALSVSSAHHLTYLYLYSAFDWLFNWGLNETDNLFAFDQKYRCLSFPLEQSPPGLQRVFTLGIGYRR